MVGFAGVVVGSLVTGGITWLTRSQDRQHDTVVRREERAAQEAREWRTRAAATLAQARAFAADLQPTILFAVIPTSTDARREWALERFDTLNGAWLALRQPLGELSVGLPEKTTRDLSEEAQSALRRTLNVVGWALSSYASGGDPDKPATTILNAEKEWAKADKSLVALREALHSSVVE